ncbi:hypothetical protein RRG08_026457 [Elysia crispata]|uniref:Uncharacterized protein n=1 Tax=Elysia crispata TaxID=231223 RepID=A0AAE1CS77_9GAST|nr:hypothetical protein RRG08_026457 [Elysia crispata]
MATQEANSAPAQNFLRQFRDKKTRKFREISASSFMDVWNHYDSDGDVHSYSQSVGQFYRIAGFFYVTCGPWEAISCLVLRDVASLSQSKLDEQRFCVEIYHVRIRYFLKFATCMNSKVPRMLIFPHAMTNS